MIITAFLVNSFSANNTGGNPAGVVLNADKLTSAEKLTIAKEIGYSETAFVAQDHEVDFAVSFFTTTEEVDFCGHATLAVFATLFEQGLLKPGYYTQRTKAGLLGVTIAEDGQITMEQALPKYLGNFAYDDLAGLLGLDETTLAETGLPIDVITTGLPDIIVSVPNGYLDQIVIDEAALSEFCQQHNVIGVHAFELCEEQSELTASCRNFAPLVGIPEESATGSASGALACYLSKHVFIQQENRFMFEQGRAMGCSSHISASVYSDEQGVSKVLVGGYANHLGTQQVVI
ncbi:putative isomerase YddE [Pseudoalteromonas sp. P1-26]|uniref:PhzF family phenazine biosynthesis protein n=1 Tax=Pseudoalteromonas sp. P1-26 TaxID=1723759 RepID=UPI0006D66C40|nr:PhzF family phenazine biosynthesis protein [Pseudoalteromonas sp. P1-26]KPZ73786.1 putative isomerase YddE [Pseudoalteromonas sp. P1-26]